MSKFETAFTKRLSLDANSFNHRRLAALDEEQVDNKSTEKDIFRYSYNLGKQRTARINRTASIGGGNPPMDGNLAKVLLGRRGLPRSLSMEAQIGRTMNETKANDSILKTDNYPHLTKQLSVQSNSEQENETTKIIDSQTSSSDQELSSKKEESGDSSDLNSKEIAIGDKKIPEDIPKKLHHTLADSVPDLRSTENLRLQREDFTGLFTSETEMAQSRPICKLRRAARRLGVSLSSEELYHKQRRNGMCTEIDDAAENRKLLRVLNKRF